MRKAIATLTTALALSLSVSAQTNEFFVQANKPGADIAPTMYGIFFEDINFAADGGLYAELVKNRSFEFPQPFMGWKTFGNVKLKDDGPFPRNPHYVSLDYSGHREKATGLENEGFFGIGVQGGEKYRFSVYARGKGAKLQIELIDLATQGDQTFCKAELSIESDEWQKYAVTLTPKKNHDKARLRIFLNGTTPVDLEHISLFPADTWRGHENGLRHDLAQALADLKPGIFRFPGGCIVEGTDAATRYQWKNTVGPVENRPLNENRWHYTFRNRFFPDYYQSNGLGFYEYFQLAEEIGAEPMPIINVGLVCQFQNDPDQQIPLDQLDEYIQDALDLIEFANGDVSTTWGKVRAEMGHPEPFNMKYLGIGNEQWDYPDNPVYTERLKRFLDVLKKQHPEIQYVGSTGPSPDDDNFAMLQPRMQELNVDLYDEHYYRDEEWFNANRHRYDNYDRKGPKVFAGEYACHVKGRTNNHFYAALVEAAFMTGFERNADVVRMATYAPLFAHSEGWQWRPNLIWFDNLHVKRTSSYSVQQLYSRYKGTNVLPLKMKGQAVCGDEGQNGLFASAVLDSKNNSIYIKVANMSDENQPLSIHLRGAKTAKSARSITLRSANPNSDNATMTVIENPALEKENKNISVNATIESKTFVIYIIEL